MISDKGKNLVFLLSLPRSGSTIASLVLGNHSKIYCPPEPWFLLKLSSLTAGGSSSNRFDDKLATKATNEFFTPLNLQNCSRNFAVTAYNQKLKGHGKEIFVDKTPRYYHILEYIDELFPQAKKIWLQRSLLDVAASYKIRWNVDIDALTGKQPSFASLDFSLGLFKLVEYFKEPTPFKMHVQYEQLVRTPENVLESICKFIGVPFESKMLQFNSNNSIVDEYRKSSFGDRNAPNTTIVTPKAVGQWSTELSPDELQNIVNLLGMEVLRALCTEDEIATLLKMGIQPPSESDSEVRRKAILNTHIDLVEELTRVADVRLRQIREKEEEVSGLKKSLDERLAAIESAASSLKEKEAEITATQKTAEERLSAIKAASKSLKEKEEEISATQRVAAERVRALHEKEQMIEDLSGIAEQRLLAIKEKEQMIKDLFGVAEQRLLAIEEKEQMIANIKKIADERERILHELEFLIKEKQKEIEKWTGIIHEMEQNWGYKLAMNLKELINRK